MQVQFIRTPINNERAILTRYIAQDEVVNLGLFICALLGHPSVDPCRVLSISSVIHRGKYIIIWKK